MERIEILLIDDEVTSRNTIKQLLKGNEQYEIAADFANGKSGLDWLRHNSADILLCDMQMPEINGVEVIRAAHLINEYLPVIAISAFDNFDYVKGCLVNGASDYLLKNSLNREQLLTTLNLVREKYRINPASSSVCHKIGYCIDSPENLTEEYIHRLITEQKIEFAEKSIVCIGISPDYVFHENTNIRLYKTDVCNALLDLLRQILTDEYQYLTCITKDCYILLFVSFQDNKSTFYILNIVNNLVSRLRRQALHMMDITLTVCVGDIQLSLKNSLSRIPYIEKMLSDKLYLGGNRVILPESGKPLTYVKEEIPENLWAQLDYELVQSVPDCTGILSDLFDFAQSRKLARPCLEDMCRDILRRISKVSPVTEEEYQAMLTKIQEMEIFEQFRNGMQEFCSLVLKRSSDSQQYSPLVSSVISYLRNNYQDDISLETCAEVIDVSYSHISRIFKQETGEGFSEYLNGLRIQKAKGLLLRRDMPMKKIVDMTGFRNYNYFFKVFREKEGMTPKEFLTKKMSNS